MSLTRAEWIAEVAAKLGHPGSMPNALYQRIEAIRLTGISVLRAARKLSATTTLSQPGQ